MKGIQHARTQPEMSQGTFEFTGGQVFELTRLNRALAQLARPGSEEEWPQLRQELIKRLWSRKRQLLRQAGEACEWEQDHPPVA